MENNSFAQVNQHTFSSQNNQSVFKRPIRVQKQYLSQSSNYPLSALGMTKYDDDEALDNETSMMESKEHSLSEIDAAIKLSMRLKRKVVQANSYGSQTFPMLVSLEVENLENFKRAHLDLVCVIDQSDSMFGDPIELVKKALKSLLEYLGDSDRLSVVVFSDSATRLFPLTRTTQENKERITSQIEAIGVNGKTNINLGMCHAFKILKERKEANVVSSIFLLSDGLDDYAKDGVSASLNDYEIPENVTIHTFGFGNDHDPLLMHDLADLRDGNFYFIEKLDTVDEAFVDCLGGLLSSIGQNVTVKIKPSAVEQSDESFGQGAAIEINKAYGGDLKMWNVEEGPMNYKTKVRNLVYGSRKDYVLELTIPPVIREEGLQNEPLQEQKKEIRVASAEVEIVTLKDQQRIVKKAELWITLIKNEPNGIEEEQEDDKEVMKHFYRVKGASIISEARHLADNRGYEEAKKVLEDLKEELENCSLRSEEFIVNLMKDIVKAIQDTDPWVYCEKGRHSLFENSRAQMTQKTNFKSSINYQNSLQKEMTSQLRAMKNKSDA